MKKEKTESDFAFFVLQAKSFVTALAALDCFEAVTSIAFHANTYFKQTLLCLWEPCH
jgi:hypothetical protein